MNVEMFVDKCSLTFPGKELTPGQWVSYREKLRRFEGLQLQAIWDWALENCKYFPKIADAYEGARELGFMASQVTDRPHTWAPTSCGMCGGSGMVAAFWSQEFELRDAGKYQVLKLVGVSPYHRSTGMEHKANHDIRSIFRCDCEAGDVETLAKGWPRWRGKDEPLTRERLWS